MTYEESHAFIKTQTRRIANGLASIALAQSRTLAVVIPGEPAVKRLQEASQTLKGVALRFMEGPQNDSATDEPKSTTGA